MIDKKTFIEFCNQHIQNQIYLLDEQIQKVKASLQNESKSSAGDKHETGRAHLQLEMEKLGKQIQEKQLIQRQFLQIDFQKSQDSVQRGSLVKTSKNWLLLSVGIGNINFDGTKIFLISASAPLGKILLGKKKGEAAEVNGNTFEILEII